MKRRLIVAILAAGVACTARSARIAPPRPDEPLAVATRDSAWFLFPAEPETLFTPTVPGARAYRGFPERAWMVQLASYFVGHVYTLDVRQEWRSSDGERPRSLPELVALSRVAPARAGEQCICSRDSPEAAVTADVVGGRVRIVVRGPSAIARVLGIMEDTVTFTRMEAQPGIPPLRTVYERRVPVHRLAHRE